MNEQSKYGIPNTDLNGIVSVLKNIAQIEKVIIYGSRAKGNYSNGSDIDLALKGEDLSLDELIRASSEIDELNLPYKIDLTIYNRIQEPALLDHINRVGGLLFDRNPK